MKIINIICLTVLFITISNKDLHSAIIVTVENLNTDNAPRMTAEISATKDGNSIELTKINILLIESFESTYPKEVTPIGNNRYYVQWITPISEYPQFNNSFPFTSFRVIVTDNGEAGNLQVNYINPGKHALSIRNPNPPTVVKELAFFGSKREQIRVFGITNNSLLGDKTKLDSITFTSPYFSYNWQGSEIDRFSRPPMELVNGFGYLVDVYFNPPDNQSYRSLMVFHYGGGMKKTLALIGGYFGIEQTAMLRLIQPNGNEKLTPCENYEIKWTGHSKDDPVKIELSIDNGASWQTVASARDSTYLWKVPNLPTEGALIRIRQDFAKANETLLRDETTRITKIAFNSNGAYAVSANINGRLAEYDIYNSNTPINNYSVKPGGYNGGDVVNIGVEYVKNNTELLYVFQENNFTFPKIAFFERGKSEPYRQVSLPDGFLPLKMHLDPARRYIVMQPRFEPRVQILSPEDGSLIGYINVNMPVSTVSINRTGDSLVIIELDGNATIYKMNNIVDYEVVNNFVFDEVPFIVNSKFSPNGELLALSVVQTDNTRTETYLFDINRRQIVRTYRPAVGAAESVDFSPSSSSLIIATRNTDQIVMFDLTGTEAKSVLAGHKNLLYDMKLDPEGFAILSSSDGEDNFLHRSFAYPELDISDNSFQIIPAQLDLIDITIPNLIIGTNNIFIYNSKFCNNGEVPVYIFQTRFEKAIHAKLLTTAATDTIYPGECKDISFVVNPLDTGMIEDALIFSSCQIDFTVPIKFRSLNRKLTLMNPSGMDFGEVCVGKTLEKQFVVFRNDDSVDVIINAIQIEAGFASPFKIVKFISDTIIAPGQTFSVLLYFNPVQLGLAETNLLIYHSNQSNVLKFASIKGTGIGTFLDVSHKRLMFIDEIDTRELIVTNTGNTELVVEQIYTEPSGYYEINTQLPINIAAKESTSITIRRINKYNIPIELKIIATPCLMSDQITIENYEGFSLLDIPEIVADPRGRADIIVKFNNTENSAYKGKRYFIGEITINPRFFLPDAIISDYGESAILSNLIKDGKRHITFRIDGDFSDVQGQLCKISGVAGLAETVQTPIEWVNQSFYWGQNVQTTAKNGIMRLMNICDGRFILQNNNNLNIQSISPNPANDIVNIIVNSIESKSVVVEIMDNSGNKVFNTQQIELNEGFNNVLLNLQYLSNGNYNLVIRSDGSFDMKKLIILR